MDLGPLPPTPTPIPPATPTATVSPTVTATATNTPLPTATPPPSATATPLGPMRTPVGGDAADDFNAMLAAMDAARSYRFHTELAIGPTGQDVTLSGDGEYQAPDRLHYTYQTVVLPVEMLIIGQESYVRQPNGAWQAGAPTPDRSPLRTPPNVRALLGLLTYAGEAQLVGDEPLPGQDLVARHLAFTIPPAPLGAAPELGWTAAAGDVWLDPATHRLARLRLTFRPADEATGNAGTLTLDFRDYDVPLTITPPDL